MHNKLSNCVKELVDNSTSATHSAVEKMIPDTVLWKTSLNFSTKMYA